MLWKWGNTHTQVFVLDLDGTLMPSAPIDNACYWEAVFACFGKQGALPDLHGFKHVTDTGILNEWCTRELGRPPRAQEITQIKQHFLQLLQAAWQHQPHHFSPLPGVVNWLQAVEKAQHVHAGIATGGWGHSARLKLKLSGLDRFKLPLASSDDAEARTAIMQVAAQKITGQPPADDAVYTYGASNELREGCKSLLSAGGAWRAQAQAGQVLLCSAIESGEAVYKRLVLQQLLQIVLCKTRSFT